MSGFSAGIDDTQLKAWLSKLKDRVEDMREPFEQIGQTLVTNVDMGFRAQKDPWGSPWTPLSESTLLGRGRRAAGKGNKLRTKQGQTRKRALSAMISAQILRDTGRLQNSLNYRASKKGVLVGTDVVYGATHQFGRDAIPPRPFLPIDPRSGKVKLPIQLTSQIIAVLKASLRESL